MTSTRKKVFIALFSLAAVVFLAAGAVVAVFAARNTTVTTGYTVSYVAIQVKATVTGSYQVKNSASATNFTPASITFYGTEKTNGTDNVKNFNSASIQLTEANNYVDFVYNITNNETTNKIDISLEDGDEEEDNLDYSYTVKIGSGTATTPGDLGAIVTGLQPGQTATITVRMQIHDVDENVDVSGQSIIFKLVGVSA